MDNNQNEAIDNSQKIILDNNQKVGIVLLALGALCIIYAVYLFTDPTPNVYIPDVVEKILTEEEVRGIAEELLLRSLEIYENPKSNFRGEEEKDEYILVHDYDEVVDKIFTEKGKTEFETVKINDKAFVDKRADGIYILATLPEEQHYSKWQLATSKYRLSKKANRLVVNFGKTELDDETNPIIFSMSVDMRIALVNDVWLIESFNFNDL